MARCGYTLIWHGEEQPCDQPATGWRWYQGHDHEDALDVACVLHENEGGRRLHAAEAKVERVWRYFETDAAVLRKRAEAAEAKVARVEALVVEREAAHGFAVSVLGKPFPAIVTTDDLRATLDGQLELAYPDLAYAIGKGGPDLDGPVALTDEPTGDAMRWTGGVDEFPFRVECPVEGCDLGVHAFVKCDLDAGRITHLDDEERLA